MNAGPNQSIEEESSSSGVIDTLPPNTVNPVPADHPMGAAQVHSALLQNAVVEPSQPVVPEAMRRVQKCASCGFPVSEGRTWCLDCENTRQEPDSAAEVPAEFVPPFLDSAKPPNESWLASHVNILAVLVLILSIVVAVVVFR